MSARTVAAPYAGFSLREIIVIAQCLIDTILADRDRDYVIAAVAVNRLQPPSEGEDSPERGARRLCEMLQERAGAGGDAAELKDCLAAAAALLAAKAAA